LNPRGTFIPAGFRDRCLQPLGHLSACAFAKFVLSRHQAPYRFSKIAQYSSGAKVSTILCCRLANRGNARLRSASFERCQHSLRMASNSRRNPSVGAGKDCKSRQALKARHLLPHQLARITHHGRRMAQSSTRVPSARTASVRLGNSAASFSITTAPDGTSTSVRPRTTAATTAQDTHRVGIAAIESGRSLNESVTVLDRVLLDSGLCHAPSVYRSSPALQAIAGYRSRTVPRVGPRSGQRLRIWLRSRRRVVASRAGPRMKLY
jgi:hypothetical protein